MDTSSSNSTMDSDSSMPGRNMMAMTFFSSTSTSLYSEAFTPSTPAGYAGACIFLVTLTILYRSLFAFKAVVEARWVDKALKRRFVVVADRVSEAERVRGDPDAKMATMTTNGIDEEVKVVNMPKRGVMPWRFSVDLPRAVLVTVMVGMGYLLMLAIMTFNIGYFFSILGGAFMGELLVGRYNQSIEEHH